MNTSLGTVNSPAPGQNDRNFTDDILRCIFVNEKFCILIIISLNFVPNGPIYNNPALIYIIACYSAIVWTNADPVHWRIYAALRGMS